MRRWCALLGVIAGVSPLPGAQLDPVVTVGRDGALEYVADAEGNRVPDFSTAGYGGGGVAIPRAFRSIWVEPVAGEDGARLQAILDAVAAWEPDAAGLRACVQLAPGVFEIEGSLVLRASGVVLRGSGAGEDGTILLAQPPGREPLIRVAGTGDWAARGDAVAVADAYTPVGSWHLAVEDPDAFAVGDRVRVHRPSTAAWIEAVGMAEAPARTPYKWRPGQWDMAWDRTVREIEGDTLLLDAPLTTALEARYGGATVRAYDWPGRLSQVGVENLRLVSAFDEANPVDEEHAWIGIQLEAVEDAWVADVTGLHFVSSLVDLGRGARRVTVQDCRSLRPVSERAGYRRLSFHTRGQQTLFLRCYAEDGQHDFVAGNLVTGPNVFLESEAHLPTGWSGSVGSWASGLLFDNLVLDGNALAFDNLGIWNQGVGWNAANSMIWQSEASLMIVRSPPTAVNWADGVWAQFEGDGRWMHTSETTQPQSLYRAQLRDRRGPNALRALDPLGPPRGDCVALAAAVPDLAARLAITPPEPLPGLEQAKGWLVAEGRVLYGGERPLTWWRGSVVPDRAATLGSSLTRFAPGMSGPGLTDDLAQLAAAMVEANEVVVRHHYGLWYDRRRDDHERTRRISADVWPPFFELPWARSGEGEAWHRLSRYDLTRFNPWYFQRLREFAALSQARGLVLVNEMYFQHNIIESGAHWVDFPWRPANAVQATDFPEPPPYDGDTIKMADAFYDLSQPTRRAWHRQYIRQCLSNLAGSPNVIHTVSAEYTGPLEFVEFWLDVIAEWQAETGHDPLIAISATKDVQDAVLADPRYQDLLDVIDFTYWYRTPEGLEFAPLGGQSLAPRQHQRLWDGGRPSAASIASMVAEYRAKFPSKAIISSLREADGWAFLAAGGSLPRLPAGTDPALLAAVAQMRPFSSSSRQWILADGENAFFGYTRDGPLHFDLRDLEGDFRIHRIDLRTGAIGPAEPSALEAGKSVSIPGSGPLAVLLLPRSS